MKILIAGASGAIGQPLIRLLRPLKYEVYGITQSQGKAKLIEEKGAKPVILDVLNKEAVFSKLAEIKPDIIIDMLARLPKEYTPESMREAAEMDTKVRSEGGSNLQAAGVANGVKRYILQSSGFWYAPGSSLADEKTSFAFEATPGIAAGCQVYDLLEKRVLESDLEGVALRFGFFYGPGTWFHPEDNMAEQVRKQQFPIIGSGEGMWNFVHIEDAAQAIVLSLKAEPGVYNIVNDQPTAMRDWVPAFAKFVGAKPPPVITEDEGLKLRGADAVYYAMHLRGASNAKAKKVLQFQPRTLEWLKQKS